MLATDRARAVAEALGRWSDSGAVLYVALADAIDEALHDRRIPPHLPSERALAKTLNVSRGTVASAYEALRERGVVERQRGSGTAARPRAHAICPDPLACVREFFATTP